MSWIDGSFWTDPKVRALKPDERYLLLYLITNPHRHFSGLYYLPFGTIVEESGRPAKKNEESMLKLSTSKLATCDPEHQMVWICNMAKHQTRRMNKVNAIEGIRNHLITVHETMLVNLFLEHYQTFNITIPKASLKHSESISDASSLSKYIKAYVYGDNKEISIPRESKASRSISDASGITEQEEKDSPVQDTPIKILEGNDHILKVLHESSYLRAAIEPTLINQNFWNSMIGLEEEHENLVLTREIVKADGHVAGDPTEYGFTNPKGKQDPAIGVRKFLKGWFTRATKPRY